MNLLILTDADACGNDRFQLADHRAEHVRSVLKLKSGDTIEVGLLNGPQGTARVDRVTGDDLVLTCEKLEMRPEPRPTVDLICALPRPQTLKKVLSVSAAMGIRRLHLVRANRVEKSYFQSPLLQPEKRLPYLLEGLSQGKLTRLPDVHVHDRFRTFFEDSLPALERAAATQLKKTPEGTPQEPLQKQALPLKLFADPEAGAGLPDLYGRVPDYLLLAVGPEGGWVPFEKELMGRLGFDGFTLGRWILRTEMAVTAALSQVELMRTLRSR